MVAIDILSVPVSASGNKCLLVVQDYFTKWADAILLPNQKAITITKALVNLLYHGNVRLYTLIRVRLLRVLSLRKFLMHLRYESHTQWPIIYKVIMALLRGLIALFCKHLHTYIDKEFDFSLCTLIEQQLIPLQAYLCTC